MSSNQRLRPVRRQERIRTLWEVQKIKESVKNFENQSQKKEESFDMWILKGFMMVSQLSFTKLI